MSVHGFSFMALVFSLTAMDHESSVAVLCTEWISRCLKIAKALIEAAYKSLASRSP